MKDYFNEFIIPDKQLSEVTTTQKAPIKVHLLWALVASGIGYASWKCSEIYNKLRKSKT